MLPPTDKLAYPYKERQPLPSAFLYQPYTTANYPILSVPTLFHQPIMISSVLHENQTLSRAGLKSWDNRIPERGKGMQLKNQT